MSPNKPTADKPEKPSPKHVHEELIAKAEDLAKRHRHLLKPWSIWPGTKFYLAECKLCGSNAIADPTFRSYESGVGGGAVQFQCRAAYANPTPIEEEVPASG